MSQDFNYGKYEDQLLDLFQAGAPDFEAAANLLALGADLNARGKDPDENILSEILSGYHLTTINSYQNELCDYCEHLVCKQDCPYNQNPNYGESMLQIIRFFLSNGFDVHNNEDRYGAQCLYALVLSSFDENMITATKLLLQAGAKNIPPFSDSNETPWDAVCFEQMVQANYYGNAFLYDLYEVLDQIYQAVDKGESYEDIEIPEGIAKGAAK